MAITSDRLIRLIDAGETLIGQNNRLLEQTRIYKSAAEGTKPSRDYDALLSIFLDLTDAIERAGLLRPDLMQAILTESAHFKINAKRNRATRERMAAYRAAQRQETEILETDTKRHLPTQKLPTPTLNLDRINLVEVHNRLLQLQAESYDPLTFSDIADLVRKAGATDEQAAQFIDTVLKSGMTTPGEKHYEISIDASWRPNPEQSPV